MVTLPEEAKDAQMAAEMALFFGRASIVLPLLALVTLFGAFTSREDGLMLALSGICALASPASVAAARAKCREATKSGTGDDPHAQMARRGERYATVGAVLCFFGVVLIFWLASQMPRNIYL